MDIIIGGLYKFILDNSVYYLKILGKRGLVNEYYTIRCTSSVVHGKPYYLIGRTYYPSKKWFERQNIELYYLDKDIKDIQDTVDTFCICKKCGIHNEYAEPNIGNEYICYNCRS